MLHYQRSGSGPVVVLLHGFPLDHTIWRAQIADLAGRYQVIAPDLPGLGKSPLPLEEDASIIGMARAVLSLLDHLGVDRFTVAGHSMGGYVALALQKLAPERVLGLGMIGSQGHPDTPEGREGRFAMAEAVRQEGPEAAVRAMLPKLFAPSVSPDSAPYQAVEATIRQSSVEGIRAALFAMASRQDMRSRLTEITAPVLVLTGDQDRAIPAERSESMVAAIERAVLVRVAGAGHMPMLERPEEVNRALADWLELVY